MTSNDATQQTSNTNNNESNINKTLTSNNNNINEDLNKDFQEDDIKVNDKLEKKELPEGEEDEDLNQAITSQLQNNNYLDSEEENYDLEGELEKNHLPENENENFLKNLQKLQKKIIEDKYIHIKKDENDKINTENTEITTTDQKKDNNNNPITLDEDDYEGPCAPKPDYSKFQSVLVYEDFTPESQQNLENLFCSLCGGIAFNAVVDTQNHLFCKHCYDLYNPRPPYFCPICNKLLKNKPTEFKKLNDLVNQQKMMCVNKNLGCKFVGTPRNFIKHIEKECDKIKLKCPLRNCNLMFYKDEIEQHRIKCPHRLERCIDCAEKMEFCQLSFHKEKCPKKKIICPQNCSLMISRDAIIKHIKEQCVNTLIHCKYYDIGCKDSFLRKDLEKHNKENFYRHQNLCNEKMLKNFESLLENNSNKMQLHEKFNKLEKSFNEKVNNLSIFLKNYIDKLAKRTPIFPQRFTQPNSMIENNKDNIEKKSNIENFLNKKKEREEEIKKNELENNNNNDYNNLDKSEKDKKLLEKLKLSKLQSQQALKEKENLLKENEKKLGLVANPSLTSPNSKTKSFNNGKNPNSNNLKVAICKENLSLTDPSIWKCRIKKNEHRGWIAMGICDKEVVTGKEENKGFFVISVNDIYYDSVNFGNEKSGEYFKEGDEISFTFYPKNKTLTYKINEGDLKKVREVQVFKEGHHMGICMILQGSDSEVEIIRK